MILESALNDLKLDQPDGETNYLYLGNNDLASLLVNYIKCNAIKNGSGLGTDAFRTDDLNVKLFTYLQKVNPTLANGFFEERKVAERMFDDALKTI